MMLTETFDIIVENAINKPAIVHKQEDIFT